MIRGGIEMNSDKEHKLSTISYTLATMAGICFISGLIVLSK